LTDIEKIEKKKKKTKQKKSKQKKKNQKPKKNQKKRKEKKKIKKDRNEEAVCSFSLHFQCIDRSSPPPHRPQHGLAPRSIQPMDGTQ
jgi:hypothetical protein